MQKKVYGAFLIQGGTAAKKPIDQSHSLKALQRRNTGIVVLVTLKEIG